MIQINYEYIYIYIHTYEVHDLWGLSSNLKLGHRLVVSGAEGGSSVEPFRSLLRISCAGGISCGVDMGFEGG